MTGCPHGDPSCPCPDFFPETGNRDPCHYEGTKAMRCPTMPDAEPGWHCHMEGCRWNMTGEDGCGLARLGPTVPPYTGWSPIMPSDGVHWVCGAVRYVDALGEDFWDDVASRA